MIFKVDRHRVTEGGVIEIQWDCTLAEQVSLELNNGYKNSTIQLPISGSKKFRLNRSKGLTKLTIIAQIKGKPYKKSSYVYVGKMKVTRAETVDNQGNSMNKLQIWRSQLVTKWRNWRNKMRYAWGCLDDKKRMAYTIMLMIGATGLVSIFWPMFTSIGMLVMLVYLIRVIKR